MREKISVAMAVYNGEQYLKEQLDSILHQLNSNDEVIVSVDPSKDTTLEILKTYHIYDKRVRIYRGPGQGVVKNFENAIYHCKNDIIFLSDQDDVWVDGKVQKVIKAFSDEKVTCILHDAYIVDKNLNIMGKSFFQNRGSRLGIARNILKNSYIGCCMAFRRDMVKKILPFPVSIPMHDQWIGICCEYYGDAKLIQEQLIKYRRHDHNVSEMSHASIKQMLVWRKNIIFNFIKLIIKKGI